MRHFEAASFAAWLGERHGALAVRAAPDGVVEIGSADGTGWCLGRSRPVVRMALKSVGAKGQKLWSHQATETALRVHQRYGVKLRRLRCAALLERTLSPGTEQLTSDDPLRVAQLVTRLHRAAPAAAWDEAMAEQAAEDARRWATEPARKQQQAPQDAAVLDLAAAGVHWDLWFGGHDFGTDADIGVTAVRGKKVDTEHVPANDRCAFLGSIERLTAEYPDRDVYFTVCPVRPGLPPGRRGSKVDVRCIPGVWVDVDTAGGAHKFDHLPTLAQGIEVLDALLARYELRDFATRVVTGGGLHAYVPFDEPLPPKSTVLDDWKTVAVDAFSSAGYHLDPGIISSPTAILRPAGTISRVKYAPPKQVALEHIGEGRVGSVRLVEVLQRDAGAIKTTKAKAKAKARPVRSYRPVAPDGPDNRAGTIFAQRIPVTTILEAMGCEHLGGNKWRRPGSESDEKHLQVYDDDDDKETATVFGIKFQAQLGLDDHYHRLSSWDLLVRGLCDNDFSLAARVAAACRTPEQTEAILAKYQTADELRRAFPRGLRR